MTPEIPTHSSKRTTTMVNAKRRRATSVKRGRPAETSPFPSADGPTWAATLADAREKWSPATPIAQKLGRLPKAAKYPRYRTQQQRALHKLEAATHRPTWQLQAASLIHDEPKRALLAAITHHQVQPGAPRNDGPLIQCAAADRKVGIDAKDLRTLLRTVPVDHQERIGRLRPQWMRGPHAVTGQLRVARRREAGQAKPATCAAFLGLSSVLSAATDCLVGGPSSRICNTPNCRSAASALMSQPMYVVLSCSC